MMKFQLNLRVVRHTKKEQAGKPPEYIVVLNDVLNKMGRLEIRSSNRNIFSRLPLDEDFSCSLDNPQQTLEFEDDPDE